MRPGARWERYELVTACALYLDPQGSRKNDIEIMMDITGRTEDSITMRWDNFASMDLALVERGRKGLTHPGRPATDVWNEFQENPDRMFAEADEYFRKHGIVRGTIDFDWDDLALVNAVKPGYNREAIVKVRVNQDSLRRAVLNYTGGRCCVTGISERQLLRVSHIVPWSESETDEQRTDIHNVLCLNPFHDALFDRHLMTVDRDHTVHYAPRLEESLGRDVFDILCRRYDSISVKKRFEPGESYLEIHNRRFEEMNKVKL